MSDNRLKKIMLDTQIYDLIIDSPNMVNLLNSLSEKGNIQIISTHIQEDQITCIPNDKKRFLINTIIRLVLPTSGNIIGISKVGKSTYGDGRSGGFGINDFRSPNRKHSEDALIATTAAKHADILVTEDKRFRNRMKTLVSCCEVWNFNQFKEYILK